jgi:cytochrome c-type biogenesis protein CcmH/NrfF
MVAVPFGHAGHILVDLIYAAPVIILVVVGLVVTMRERRRERSRNP